MTKCSVRSYVSQSHLELCMAIHMTILAHEMGLEGIVFNVKFGRIGWGIFILLFSPHRLDKEVSGGPFS